MLKHAARKPERHVIINQSTSKNLNSTRTTVPAGTTVPGAGSCTIAMVLDDVEPVAPAETMLILSVCAARVACTSLRGIP